MSELTAHTTSTSMDADTLEALKGSIAKWEGIVAGTTMDFGSTNCPLCMMFAHSRNCYGCPVAAAVGQRGCMGTPYMNGEFRWVELTDGRRSYQPTYATACEERDFLKSLLPNDTDDVVSTEGK